MNHEDIRICFVGDSLVNGTGDETALGWAGRLCDDAKNKGHLITYYNLGIRRNTSHDILMRIKTEVSLRLSDALSSTYDSRIVLSFGVNDTAIENGSQRVSEQDSIVHLIKMIEFLKPEYKIIIIGPPPVNDDDHNQRIQSLSEQFKLQTASLGVPYIDLFLSLKDDASYIQEITENDGAHPRANGYNKMAKIITLSKHWWFSGKAKASHP